MRPARTDDEEWAFRQLLEHLKQDEPGWHEDPNVKDKLILSSWTQ